MNNPTREQMRADLARAMFPTAVIEPSSSGNGVDIRIHDKPNETRSWYDFDPFTDHADYHALVACWQHSRGIFSNDSFLLCATKLLTLTCVTNCGF